MEVEHDGFVEGTLSDVVLVLQVDWVEVREELGVKETEEMKVFVFEGNVD